MVLHQATIKKLSEEQKLGLRLKQSTSHENALNLQILELGEFHDQIDVKIPNVSPTSGEQRFSDSGIDTFNEQEVIGPSSLAPTGRYQLVGINEQSCRGLSLQQVDDILDNVKVGENVTILIRGGEPSKATVSIDCCCLETCQRCTCCDGCAECCVIS